MQYRLQLPDDTIADTNEDGVAIIDSPMYKGMGKCMSSIKRQRSTDEPQLSKLVETATYVSIHRQPETVSINMLVLKE